MEKDELPSAQEQMGLYHRQQTRPDDNDISLEELQNYVKQRFETPAQRYSEVNAAWSSLAPAACLPEVGKHGQLDICLGSGCDEVKIRSDQA